MFSQNSTAMHAFIACKQSLCLIAQNIKICTFCSWNHILHKPFEKQEYLGVFFVHVNSVLRWFFDIICIELLAKIDLWAPPYFFLFFRLGPHYSGMGVSTFTSKFIFGGSPYTGKTTLASNLFRFMMWTNNGMQSKYHDVSKKVFLL